MSMECDAILFYGYLWEDEQAWDFPDEVHELWESREPVMVTSHNTDSYPCPIIYVTASEHRAYRGSPLSIPRQLSTTDQLIAWGEELDLFVERFNIDLSEAKGPDWFLASFYSR